MILETISLLENRHILLGVTGSIAVYKAVDLASKLTQAGALVDVIMTEAAQRFVSPLTFQAVTGRAVYTDMWGADDSGGLPTHIAHVGLGEEADLLLVAPATANTIARLAAGLADDLLSVTVLASRCPVMIAPAMDGGMYEHPATQANIAALLERGVALVEPETGRFASGLVGKGRLPDTPTLIGWVRYAFGQEEGILAERKVIVTAGGTREALDPVRYLTNRSSGKQGYALAQAAIDAGAAVTLITTTDALPRPTGAARILVNSAEEMRDAVMIHIEGADALLMAAAVADFRPAKVAAHKIKKEAGVDGLALQLERTPDILMAVKAQRAATGWPRIVVGFAAESQDLLDNAAAKLERKELDLIVANDITGPGSGFQADTNRVTLLDASGDQNAVELSSKTRIGEIIIERVAALLGDL